MTSAMELTADALVVHIDGPDRWRAAARLISHGYGDSGGGLAVVRIIYVEAGFTGRPEGPRLPDATACLPVAISHSPAIDAANVASRAALPATRAITPATSATAPIAETSTT